MHVSRRRASAGSWGAIAGELRYFADKSGNSRAGIEGTQVPMHLIRRYATRGEVPAVLRREAKRAVSSSSPRTLEYFGFELERETEALDDFSGEDAARARQTLADSLARGVARHQSVKRNRAAIDELREVYRRSGGTTTRLGLTELTDWYAGQLSDVNSMDDFRNGRFTLDRDDLVPPDVREKFLVLPSSVIIRDREVDIDYDVEERDAKRIGVARLRLPEKLARSIDESELPVLDRPLRFVVIRGQRGAIRADTLDELQEILERPWSPDEVEDEGDRSEPLSHPEKRARELAAARRDEARKHRGGHRRDGGAAPGGRRPGRGKGPRGRFRGR